MSHTLIKVLVAGLLASAAVRAQEETPTFRTEIKEVTLHVSVIDKSGKLVTNIPRSAFKVYEDNVEQPIKLFRREDVPVSMGILVDNSGSMNDKRTRVAAAALTLAKASNPDDEVFIVNFNDDPYLDQSFTHDTKKLEEALARIDARGGTAMRNAISGAIDYIKTDAKLDKKVIVVITDGNDNSSAETTLEQLLRKVRDSGILVYSIGLLSEEVPREARAAKRALTSLAETSAGAAYFPKDLAEVEKMTPEIALEIRNQYTIAYSPLNGNLDGSFRKIRVELTGQFRGATVRAKNGYYATPAPAKSTVSLGKAVIGIIWQLAKGNRLRPWRSPYLRWRIETYWGLHADRISPAEFRAFVWDHRAELLRFARWAAQMKSATDAAGRTTCAAPRPIPYLPEPARSSNPADSA